MRDRRFESNSVQWWRAVVPGAIVALVLAVVVGVAGARPFDTADPRPTVARMIPAHGVVTKAELRSIYSPGDVPTAGWTASAAMTTAVDTPGGAGFRNSKVYVPGGIKADGTLHDKMQTYDVPTDTWTEDTADVMGGPWADMAVCAVSGAGGKVYAVNGHDNMFIYAALQVYNPSGAPGTRWSYLSFPTYPDPVACPTDGNCYYFSQGSGCAVIANKLYLFGGFAGVGDLNAPAGITNATWVYDIATDTWSDSGMSMTGARFWFGYTSSATTAFAVNGTNNLTTFAPTATTEQFTPAGGWVALPNTQNSQARLAPGLALMGTRKILFGGATFDALTGTFTVQNTARQCIGACTSWGNFSFNMGSPRWFMGWASGLSGSSRFYAAGGHDGAMTVNSAERFVFP